jgi:hypothetical protein
MNEQTHSNNWPDPTRPGYPLEPEEDGWHWLIGKYTWSESQPYKWCPDPGVWRGHGTPSDASHEGLRYIAPARPEDALLRLKLEEMQRKYDSVIKSEIRDALSAKL